MRSSAGISNDLFVCLKISLSMIFIVLFISTMGGFRWWISFGRE